MAKDICVMRECVKAWLRHIRAIDMDLRAIELAIEDIYARLEGLGASTEPGGGGYAAGDAMVDGIAKIAELKAKWSAQVAEHYDEYNAAWRICCPTYLGRYAMWLHEVKRLSWGQIGEEIGYSERRTRMIAEAGVRDLYEIIPEEYRRNTFPDAIPE